MLIVSVSATPVTSQNASACNTLDGGFQCFSNLSHRWGQYSPYFAVENDAGLSSDIPPDCQITFAQVLSRHGARFPTDSKGEKYSNLITGIQKNVTSRASFTGKYAFLGSYRYNLGENDLTQFGENQLVDSGVKFYQRYENLTRKTVPFMRASGSNRVIASGEKFGQGFQQAKNKDPHAKRNQTAPAVSVIIEEGEAFNNTLDHGICAKFENSELSDNVKHNFTDIFAPAIRDRLQSDLPGVTLSNSEVIYLMDMCSFDTVARTADASELSPFCHLFTDNEWAKYNYLLSLKKYYGHGAGNPLGPAQGIGYTNELIARLTQAPVHDHTTVNHTLDTNPATFPLNAQLYADFSHDNAMLSIFFAMGLYNSTDTLPRETVTSASESGGYSAAWVVPFGARAYVEMMHCRAEKEPLVRVLVNDRVVPLHGCEVDAMGRCRRDDFVRGLSFAREGGNWGSCFS